MTTLEEMEAIQAATAILDRALVATVNGTDSVFAIPRHAKQHLNQRMECLLAAEVDTGCATPLCTAQAVFGGYCDGCNELRDEAALEACSEMAAD